MKIREVLQSQNGVYRLVLNDTGNLEIWCKREKLWTTNTDDNYVNSLVFNNDGKIYHLGKDNSSRWQSKLSSTNSKPHLMLLQNDGNLVVYNECGNKLWESRARGKCDTIPGIYDFHKFVTLTNLFLTKCIPAGFVIHSVVIIVANFTVQISLIHLYHKTKNNITEAMRLSPLVEKSLLQILFRIHSSLVNTDRPYICVQSIAEDEACNHQI